MENFDELQIDVDSSRNWSFFSFFSSFFDFLLGFPREQASFSEGEVPIEVDKKIEMKVFRTEISKLWKYFN